MAKSIKKPISYKQKTEADIQLKELQRQVDYDTKDYTVELIVTKFDRGDFLFRNIKEIIYGLIKIIYKTAEISLEAYVLL